MSCTCGASNRSSSIASVRGKGASPRRIYSNRENNRRDLPLDASFVHLARPPPQPLTSVHEILSTSGVGPLNGGAKHSASSLFGEGFVEVDRHANVLLRAACGEGSSDAAEDGGDMPSLCQQCLDRVIRAIDADAERLRSECKAYEEAVKVEEEQQARLRKTVAANFGMSLGGEGAHGSVGEEDAASNSLIASTIDSFQQEVHVLRAACENHERELDSLTHLLADQSRRTSDLLLEEQQLHSDLNSLEINGKAFDSTNRQMANQCRIVQKESSSLRRVCLPRALFELQIDSRGLRYPLINNLRLAYRPKGDVHWHEINAAWSQAAQLVLFVGGMVKFASRDLRIVPLTSCAKIIAVTGNGKKRAYNLGKDFDTNKGGDNDHNCMAPSLRALHSLLEQLFRHISALSAPAIEQLGSSVPHRTSSSSPPGPSPHALSHNQIGTTNLLQLHDRDDTGWSTVVQCTASNLKWLSDHASFFASVADVYSTPFSTSPRVLS